MEQLAAGQGGPKEARPAHRRLTDWHRARVLASYRREGSIARAAAAAGVSKTSAYNVLVAAGVVRRLGTFTTAMAREAVRLYVDEHMSDRRVAAELARLYPHARPSHMWVRYRVREAGVTRSRSRANVFKNSLKTGRDYDALRRQAADLAERKLWSVRRIARHLGISRRAVKAYVGPEHALGLGDSVRRQAWEADTPAARRRRELRLRALELRIANKTMAETKAILGVSIPTLSKWYREDGLRSPRLRRSS